MPQNDWRYRHADEHGIVHIESEHIPRRGALKTACGTPVNFGEPWDDDRSVVVTCLRCLGAR